MKVMYAQCVEGSIVLTYGCPVLKGCINVMR